MRPLASVRSKAALGLARPKVHVEAIQLSVEHCANLDSARQ